MNLLYCSTDVVEKLGDLAVVSPAAVRQQLAKSAHDLGIRVEEDPVDDVAAVLDGVEVLHGVDEDHHRVQVVFQSLGVVAGLDGFQGDLRQEFLSEARDELLEVLLQVLALCIES
jgi:hypothetical protein